MSTQEATIATPARKPPAAGSLHRALLWIWRPQLVLPMLAFVGFIAIWQWFSGRVNPILFPAPMEVLRAYRELWNSGDLWPAFLTTMKTLSLGFLLAALVGIVGGILVGRLPVLGVLVDPYLEAIYATPRVVITPLVILWFGIGDNGRLFIVFIGTFIPILVNTAVGVRNARQDLIEVGRSFGASERELVQHVILPGAVPFVIAGLRIGIGRALIGVVIAEIFLDLTGLGGLIQTDASYFRVDRMIAVVLILALLGTILMAGLGKLEQHFSTWRAVRQTGAR
jgi:ABC-type nitrate/sulfonate/bicarbonate transport system permease component